MMKKPGTYNNQNAALPVLSRALAPLQQALAGLQPRERGAVTLALWVVVLGLLWWIVIAPAWTTLRQAPERHVRLDAQLSQMRGMAASTQALRGQTAGQPPARDTALRALDQATTALGANGQIAVRGERATLTLNNATPEALAQWLQQVRINARLVPVEAKLNRPADSAPVWSGSLVVAGPGLAGGNSR
jgi:general secretion pathway protein M